MPTKYTDVKGHAIYYHYRGATTLPDVIPDFSRGRKIVFLHPEGGNGAPWHNQIDALGRKHSPVAFDFPGHGRSDGVEGLKSIGEYADFLAAFMDALQFQSAVIAGWSMGGAVAMEFALRYPARVEALILVATAAKFAIPEERIQHLYAVMMGRAPQAFVTDGFSSKTVKDNFNVVREMWMEQIKTDPRVRYTDTRACQEFDLSGAISAIGKPILILGAEAGTAGAKDAELIRDKIRGARLDVVPDAGNMIPVEQPIVVNDAIEEFLGELK
ncbi:MAG: alpha/beta fold hydrolase [Deltaproteobacteria bacterium]|nr:alpha/beta fold hydrolase [Deltaproteobacteria bacterium]